VQPTILNPWYVVFREVTSSDPHPNVIEYYRPGDDATAGTWSSNKHDAMLFLSVHAATRVAAIESADVLMLWTKAQVKEYRND
jgi:hypothetical protein